MSEESAPDTSAINDLIDDSLGGVPSATSDIDVAASPSNESDTSSPVTEQVPQAQEPAPVEAVASQTPNAQTPSQPTTPGYRIGDREYSAKELQDALVSSQQLGHLQQKYVGLLEQSKQWQGQPQQVAQQGQSQPQVNVQQQLQAIRAKYDPIVQEAVKSGAVEADFAALFPGMAAQMLMYRDGFNQLAQQMGGVAQNIQQTQQRAQSQGLVSDIGRSINALAQSGDAFAPLKDPNQVQGFFSYLWELNPQIGHLKNPDFLARQWVAYNKDQFLQNSQAQQVAAQRQQQARFARPDGLGNARPAGVYQQPERSPLDQMADDFFQRSL